MEGGIVRDTTAQATSAFGPWVLLQGSLYRNKKHNWSAVYGSVRFGAQFKNRLSHCIRKFLHLWEPKGKREIHLLSDMAHPTNIHMTKYFMISIIYHEMTSLDLFAFSCGTGLGLRLGYIQWFLCLRLGLIQWFLGSRLGPRLGSSLGLRLGLIQWFLGPRLGSRLGPDPLSFPRRRHPFPKWTVSREGAFLGFGSHQKTHFCHSHSLKPLLESPEFTNLLLLRIHNGQLVVFSI